MLKETKISIEDLLNGEARGATCFGITKEGDVVYFSLDEVNMDKTFTAACISRNGILGKFAEGSDQYKQVKTIVETMSDAAMDDLAEEIWTHIEPVVRTVLMKTISEKMKEK